MSNELDTALASSGMTLRENASGVVSMRPRGLHARPLSERAMNCHARCERILQGIARKSTIEGAVNGAEHPELARELVRLYVHFQLRHQAAPLFGVDLNPFRHLSEMDAALKLWRLMEDICDRSTGRMGPWTGGISETAAAARRAR